MASITLQEVEKRFGETAALRPTDLEIRDHEFLVLVGPSGSGKTTLLRLIAGLETLTGGEIYFGDQRVTDVDVGDRDIAMVFQNYGLYPHMSVFGNMAFGLRRRRMDRAAITDKVQEAARLLRIEHLLERKPRQLSGGQRQRVALGRAIVRDPAVFLLDEPLSNLDAHLRVQMRAEILKVHRAVTATAVYVTHDQVEAMTMGDRIAVMSDGVIQQVGTPDDLYDHPVNRFVAGFIGTPSMGFVECAREPGEPDLLTGTGVRLRLPAERVAALPAKAERVSVGVRPERLTPTGRGDAESASCTIEGVVEVVEPLGSEQHVLVAVGEQTVTAKGPREEHFEIGEKVVFALDPGHLHIFDAESGEALT
ncbi:MAG: sn-glycerol-3-phosphate ABC transporter ATP-binding protein UgpC [Streptosporangiales bacterium]|nr:sn-glycerol-3-phosphate ABC transporter ATP-binding protein UgpC [Streptosporangiales bacterium]MBO0891366.1 sn-glycerol-3-phosphate ABC transporter ATP-binding protein UgpC [Acidothermales bacterium]